MKCNRGNSKRFHTVEAYSVHKDSLQSVTAFFFTPYGQASLPSRTSVTLCVITYFLIKLHTSQSPAFVKWQAADFLSFLF